jgi:hypothetical protein
MLEEERKYKAEQREAIDQGRGVRKEKGFYNREERTIINKRNQHLHRYCSWYECWSSYAYGHR